MSLPGHSCQKIFSSKLQTNGRFSTGRSFRASRAYPGWLQKTSRVDSGFVQVIQLPTTCTGYYRNKRQAWRTIKKGPPKRAFFMNGETALERLYQVELKRVCGFFVIVQRRILDCLCSSVTADVISRNITNCCEVRYCFTDGTVFSNNAQATA